MLKEKNKIYKLENNQITFFDQRFYKQENNEYYPSITSILGYDYKGPYYIQWLKETGFNSEIIMEKAGREGTQVHELIEDYLNGKEIKWLDENNRAKYSKDVWSMFHKFHKFWTFYKPELLGTEMDIVSHIHKFAGRTDLKIKINDKKYIIDIKTSNNLSDSFEMQTSAYIVGHNEMYPEDKIDNSGILWLKAKTTKDPKEADYNNIQGKGWKLIFNENSIEDSFNSFLDVYKIYKRKNKNIKPHMENYPLIIKKEM